MTKKVIRFLIKLLVYIFVVLFLIYLFIQMRQIGYLIFADQAKDQAEVAKEAILTVTEGESVLDISKDLSRMEIVGNPYIFAITLRCSEEYKNIQPGEYVLQSSDKPSEILSVLIHKGEEQE